MRHRRFERAACWALLVALALGLGAPQPAEGQRRGADPAGVFARAATPNPAEPSRWEQERPWAAPLASALLPGAGQLLRGQRRGWAYVAVEAVVWIGYGLERRRGRDDRGRYQDLAWNEARTQTGPRVDGDFEYYERLSQWTRSGAYDADPVASGLQPETDPATFNGDAWRLAEGIFGGGGGPLRPGDPGYASAVDFYRDRAYGDAFLWDWTGAPGGQDRFESLIDASDDHFQRASLILGGVLLNRVVSALDAAISRHAPSGPSLELDLVDLSAAALRVPFYRGGGLFGASSPRLRLTVSTS